MIKIEALRVFPVKSCAGMAVPYFDLHDFGPSYFGIHDRQFMWVDEAGVFVTQRKFPQMALVKTFIPSWGSLQIQIQKDQFLISQQTSKSLVPVQVWKSQVQARHVPGPWESAMSDFLGLRLRLVEFSNLHPREKTAMFADGEPYLLLHLNSVEHLRKQGAHPDVTELNFRGNIIVSSDQEGFADERPEDQWEQVQFQNARLVKTKLCDRCVMVNVSPETGVVDQKENLKVLANPKRPTGVTFGLHLRLEKHVSAASGLKPPTMVVAEVGQV